jgi:hypothetical protein
MCKLTWIALLYDKDRDTWYPDSSEYRYNTETLVMCARMNIVSRNRAAGNAVDDFTATTTIRYAEEFNGVHN